jgi:hypothetical protein
MGIRVQPCKDCGTEPEAYTFVGSGWVYNFLNETWQCVACVKKGAVYRALVDIEKQLKHSMPPPVNQYAEGIQDGLNRAVRACYNARKAINESHTRGTD